MSRVIIFLRSPVALSFIGMYTGKTNPTRRDLSPLWNVTPNFLAMMAMGGPEMYNTMKRGVTDFDTALGYVEEDVSTNYAEEDMVKCLSDLECQREVEAGVEDVLAKSMQNTTVVSFVKTHKKWMLGGTLAGVLGLVVVLYFFVNRRKALSLKRKHVGE